MGFSKHAGSTVFASKSCTISVRLTPPLLASRRAGADMLCEPGWDSVESKSDIDRNAPQAQKTASWRRSAAIQLSARQITS
jgi:hypothetical protein